LLFQKARNTFCETVETGYVRGGPKETADATTIRHCLITRIAQWGKSVMRKEQSNERGI